MIQGDYSILDQIRPVEASGTKSKQDISLTLISEKLILQKLPAVLIDSIVVDQAFNIVVVSQNVLDFLEFSIDELRGKNLNYLAGKVNLVESLRGELVSGYFEERQSCLFTKSNYPLPVSVAGFYLGLVIDYSDYILLRIRNTGNQDEVNQQLQAKKLELDNFIYRTSHDLRGPLATIKGLLNLVKIRKNEEELDRLVAMLEAHANKLDERLFQLVYWAQADMDSDPPQNVVDFSCVEKSLRKIIEQNAFVDFLELHFAAPPNTIHGLNELLVSSLFGNILMYILSLPMSNLQNQISYSIARDEQYLKITIGALGFALTDTLRRAIAEHEFIYTDMINYPQLIHFYSAQKIVRRLKGSLRAHFIAEDSQRISILIPLSESSTIS